MTTFPDGVYQWGGAPVGGARFSSPWATHYFVDATDGSDAFDGTAPQRAKATIQAAVTAASAQDVIYVRPKPYQWGRGFRRYTEDVVVPVGSSTGTGEISNNASISLIGVTPRTASAGDINGVRMSATTTAVTVNTQAFHMENIDIFAEGKTSCVTATSTAWTLGADGLSLYNCAFKGANVILMGSSDQAIVGCRFTSSYDGTVSGVYFSNNGNHQRPLIKGCEFLGGTSTAAADGPWITKQSGCIIYEGIIRDCYFSETPTGNVYINLSTDGVSSGMISNLYLAVTNAEGGEIVPDGMVICGIHDSGGLATA